MLDSTTYAASLFSAVTPEQYGVVVECLDAMAGLVHEKPRVIAALPSGKLVAALKKQLDCPDAFARLLHVLAKNNDLYLLPRIAKAFRRQLSNAQFELIEVTTAANTVDTKHITEHFGKKAVMINHLDPNLIAGIRITTATNTYEYSASTQLEALRNALEATGKE